MVMKYFVFLMVFILSLPGAAQNTKAYEHLTYSQVGYDIGFPKNAMIQDVNPSFLGSDASYVLRKTSNGRKVLGGKIEAPRQKWDKYWWKLDFSNCNEAGEYYLEVYNGKNLVLISDKELPIKIGESVLWNESWYATALEQLYVRDSLSYQPEGGWKDCGSTLQEISSHAIMLNALCDLLDLAPGMINEKQKKEIYYHLVIGADYVAKCQDRATEFGYKDGAVVHEVRENYKVVTGNVAKTAMILARVSRLIKDVNPVKSSEYKQRSIKSFTN